MRRNQLSRKGITLIAALMMVIFASIAVMGVTTFIIQVLARAPLLQAQTKCIYLAQAGIHHAIYWFRFHDRSGNGYFTLGQSNIDAGNFFVLGGTAADMLMVKTSSARIGGSGSKDLLGLTIQNATNSKTITIDRMVISWNNIRKLNIIRINGSNVFNSSAGVSSPANIDITNFTLNTTPTIYNINYLRFNGNMSGSTISIQFVMMTDGSSRTLTVFPASNNNIFTVKSMGKTASSNIYRTIKADYNALTGKITDYDEISAPVP